MDYQIFRSKRRTLSIGVSKDLEVVVRAPMKLEISEIERFLFKHQDWIEKQKIRMEKAVEDEKKNQLTKEQIEKMKKDAKVILPERVEYYSNIMRVYPTGIKITSAKTRWGSCSGKNALCFSYHLMKFPIDVIDYVIVHELAHIQVKNHSKKFYAKIEKILPDYKERKYKLKCNN